MQNAMIKFANLSIGFYRECHIAVSDAKSLSCAFPFGADWANAYACNPIRQGTVIAYQSVGFEPKIRVVPRCAILRLVLMCGTALFLLPP